jgi:DNA polymerase-3 subunit gamma/tau
VNDIRSLTEQVRIPPQLGKYKVYIIDEVHMLSQQAFNAFLKTLEEPPRHAIFILATTEKHKIIPTILSRCQIYDFSRIKVNDIAEHLAYVAGKENVKYEPEALNVIAQKADGGMRDALSVFDQVVSFSQGNVTYKTVIENLNVLDYDYYFRLTENMLNCDISAAVLLLNEILGKGFDGHHILAGLTLFFRDLLICQDPQTIVLFESGKAVREKYLALSKLCKPYFLLKTLEMTNETELSYQLNKNKRFALELLLIKLCQINSPSNEGEDKKKTVIEPFLRTEEQKTPPTQTKTETPPAPQAGKKFGTVRINETPEQPTGEVERETVTDTAPAQNQSFSKDELMKAWREFTTASTDAYLKNTMQYVTPSIVDGCAIEIEVCNPKQEEVFKSKLGDLKTFLIASLKNNEISISLRIREEDAGNNLFTSKDKFRYMAEKNPELENLVREFGLSLD